MLASLLSRFSVPFLILKIKIRILHYSYRVLLHNLLLYLAQRASPLLPDISAASLLALGELSPVAPPHLKQVSLLRHHRYLPRLLTPLSLLLRFHELCVTVGGTLTCRLKTFTEDLNSDFRGTLSRASRKTKGSGGSSLIF